MWKFNYIKIYFDFCIMNLIINSYEVEIVIDANIILKGIGV